MPLESYSDIGNVDAGDTIDPTWGDGVRSNQSTFASLLQAGSIEQASSTQVTVNNTTTETTIMTYTIPGGKLSTDNVYRFEIIAKLENTTGGPESITFRMKYGSTTISTSGSVSTSGGETYLLRIDGFLGANLSTTAQWGGFRVTRTRSTGSAETGGQGLATETSTGDLDLVVTAQWAGANSGYTLIKYFNIVEYHEV